MTKQIDKQDEERIENQIEEKEERNINKSPHSDVYGDIEGVDPETKVEIPTEDAVDEAKRWVDEENRR